jgi:hypothetical protein
VKRPIEDNKVLRAASWVLAIGGLIAAAALIARMLDANYTTDLAGAGGTWWDFRDAGFFPVRAVLDGVLPYDVDAYFATYPVAQEFPLLPPMYIVLHAPFQLLGLTTASFAMLALNVVGFGLLTAWSLRLSRYRLTPLMVMVAATLVMISNGGRNNLFSGQVTVIFVAGAYLALTASGAARGSIGIFVSLIKLGIGAPVTILVAAAGRYRRAIVGLVAAAVTSLVLMVPFVAWAGGASQLVGILMDNAAFSAESRWISLETTSARVDASATIAMIFDVVPSQSVQLLVAALVIGGSALVLFVRRSVLDHRYFNDAVIVLVCLATVTSIYHSFYDLVILILPTFLLTRRDFAGGDVPRMLRMVMLGSLLIAAFNPFRVESVASVLGVTGRSAVVLATGLTGVALLVALVVAVAVVWRLPKEGTNHIASAEGD